MAAPVALPRKAAPSAGQRVGAGLRWLRRHPTVLIGLAILLLAALMAVFAPVIASHDPMKLDPLQRLKPPSAAHWFGTDHLGRDVFSRTVYGARVSLIVGFSIAFIACAIGLVIGLVSGFVRVLDPLVMRIMDGLMAIPAILLAIAIVGGQVLSHLMKFSFARPRPELVPHIVEVSSASFPSGHSMMSAVTYLTLAVMLARTERRIRIRVFYIVVAAILTMLVGLSRVYLGVHWPSDVLGGWSLGAAWALGVWLLARRMGEHGQIEPEKSVDS